VQSYTKYWLEKNNIWDEMYNANYFIYGKYKLPQLDYFVSYGNL